MQNVCIVDTSICTDNLGDETIMDAVNGIIVDMFPNAYITRVPSHEALSGRTRRFIYDADFCFIGGTNLISSSLNPLGLWRISAGDARVFSSTHTILLGVGWNDYQSAANPATQRFLKMALSPAFRHSVRDRYTQSHLNHAGINSITTSCMTMWTLTPAHCANIPRRKSGSVVISLTQWRRNPELDGRFISAIKRHYKRAYFFPQQFLDYSYLRSLGFDIPLAATTNAGYSRFLESEDVDFIGTRLHGGIRAMQKGRRALILAVDNRAAEIGRDTDLPVRDRADIAGIESWIDAGEETAIRLPEQAIREWKAQFDRGRRGVDRPARGRPPEPDFRGLPLSANLLRRARYALAPLYRGFEALRGEQDG